MYVHDLGTSFVISSWAPAPANQITIGKIYTSLVEVRTATTTRRVHAPPPTATVRQLQYYLVTLGMCRAQKYDKRCIFSAKAI